MGSWDGMVTQRDTGTWKLLVLFVACRDLSWRRSGLVNCSGLFPSNLLLSVHSVVHSSTLRILASLFMHVVARALSRDKARAGAAVGWTPLRRRLQYVKHIAKCM